jgi:Tfp pilus assembly pilus retraction ATPase PilT
MHLMDNSLEFLYKQGKISRESAMAHAKDPAKFLKL